MEASACVSRRRKRGKSFLDVNDSSKELILIPLLSFLLFHHSFPVRSLSLPLFLGCSSLHVLASQLDSNKFSCSEFRRQTSEAFSLSSVVERESV